MAKHKWLSATILSRPRAVENSFLAPASPTKNRAMPAKHMAVGASGRSMNTARKFRGIRFLIFKYRALDSAEAGAFKGILSLDSRFSSINLLWSNFASHSLESKHNI